MVANNTIIEVNDLDVRFGRQEVLRDISLEIPTGQSIAIIGESGCGKTVLLKTLIGLIRPTNGNVIFDSQRLDKLSDQSLAQERTRFGFVFQNAALFDSMTVAENVTFPLRQHRADQKHSHHEEMNTRLAEVGLPTSVLRKRPAELSGGMRKRVGLARALVMHPEILLYDEPTTGLDPIMSDVINELMIRTRKKNEVTSIMVTHDMKSASKVAERIVMLYPISRLKDDEPQIIFDGTPEQIERSKDKRVSQFYHGEAGDRLTEMGEDS
jgi:phospholipid/cholesterol/gamma-HCH transport system ATP-binding protein